MAAITWADVVNHVSALSTVDVDQQADLLALANAWLNVSMFGGEDSSRVKMLRIYIAAHFASLPGTGTTGGGATTAGPVIAERTSEVSRAYANSQAGDDAAALWTETIWGRRYLAIVRTSRARWPVVA